MRGVPSVPRHGLSRTGQVLWEDVVYGASEGMLLSVLPVLTVWQALERLGWTTGWAGKLGTGALSLGASVVVIAAHHLGYRDFRGRQLVLPVAGCLWFGLAYVITASPLAAVAGHIGLHAGLDANDMQLPPYREIGGIHHVAPAARQAA